MKSRDEKVKDITKTVEDINNFDPLKHLESIIVRLWMIIDDIDTYSDIFKDNYEGFARAVYKKDNERFDVIPLEEIEKMTERLGLTRKDGLMQYNR